MAFTLGAFTLAQVKLFSGVLLYVYMAAFVPLTLKDELLSSTKSLSCFWTDRTEGSIHVASCILILRFNMLCVRQSQSEALFFIGVHGHSEMDFVNCFCVFVFVEGVPPIRSNSNDICVNPLLFSRCFQ